MASVRPGEARRPRALSAADRLVLRLAFAATFGFAVALRFEWEFSFLTPMLAVQILAAMPMRPSFGQGIAIPLVIFLGTNAALVVSSLLADAPIMLLAVVGLVICWTFYGQRRGAPAIVMLLIQIAFSTAPLMATISFDLARAFAEFMQRGSLAAVVIVWISHGLFPAPAPAARSPGAAAAAAGLEPARAARIAISDTLVLLPLMAAFMSGGDVNNVIILMIALNLLREVDPSRTGGMALGLFLGNLLGGIVAVVAQQFVLIADSLVQFLLTVFLVSLWLAGRAARGGRAAPIFALGLATFILLLGVAITPLPGGSEEIFLKRLAKVGLASLYVLGALSLVTRLRLGRPRVGA